MTEEVIEWIRGESVATITACSSSRLNGKIRKLAQEHEECQIIRVNDDGSILAHVPVKWIKVSPPRKVSEEQRQAAADRFRKMRENR